MSLPAFNAAVCAAALGADANTFQLNVLAECDSTNTQLMQLAESGAPSGTVIVAERQTSGRGRRERIWVSSPQHSLTFSLLWRFSTTSSAPEALSLVVGLGLQYTFAIFGAKVAVKWPNDILFNGRKLAGVLIEAQPGDIKSVVIGVGINLHLPSDLAPEIACSACALDEALPQLPAPELLLATLLLQFAAIFNRYEVEGFAALRDAWQAQHAFQNREVRISGGHDDVQGICMGVTDHGELLINAADGVRRIISGDVSLRLS